MSDLQKPAHLRRRLTRRDFLFGTLTAAAIGSAAVALQTCFRRRERQTAVFIARANSYEADLRSIIADGLRHLGVQTDEVRGKRILLKPNLIETIPGALHICTQPQIICAVAEVFLGLGAAEILIGEGSGHSRDMLRVVEETGLAQMLRAQKLTFVDLNNDELINRRNASNFTGIGDLTLPAILDRVDWIISMPKMKTHHWAGVTLAMKNLFGLLPGVIYGWPKNVLHVAGIHQSIVDVNATVRPHFAIVDGIVGMEGDGPVMGTPKTAGVVVMGRDVAATDATAARVMGIDPWKIPYFQAARGWLGTISAGKIVQRGETIRAVRTDFQLLDHIHAHQGLRWNGETS